ncbi:hypothetical protein SAMN05444156_2749 [Verrucomicrobium sp. GAS474]|uniref:hypothetical protein n=1 Tax=Verrucomicrobium sp. GAS474 TaxID=1882831 RepID=UPI00087A3F55|nr:hypothetical protein [Verrucomicrobium sp. GAS474]SDU23187.1 hypothetical protein SAMN05444156_2749 [Verrucomicrobium sp. GAS474]
MSSAPLNSQGHARLYLHAVLPCFVDLIAQDAAAREVVARWNARIVLRIVDGPAATLTFRGGSVAHVPEALPGSDVTLLFLSAAHLNAFFAGNAAAVPLPVWGAWRIGLLTGFSKVAERLEAVLEGEGDVLATAEGRRVHARLTLIAAGLGLRPLAEYDVLGQATLKGIPQGLAAFSIGGEADATVWFENRPGAWTAGWSQPPRRPDVQITFADIDVAYAALRDEADTYAAVGLGQITVDGLVPLADGLNLVMERLRDYLE